VTEVDHRVSSEFRVLFLTMDAIIDCDILEASKENIQPLPSGRRVTALSAVLSTPHAQRESQHQAIKAKHRLLIQRDLSQDEEGGEEDTPNALQAYTSFIHWTLDAYPQGPSAESGLLELIEEATRVLKDHHAGKWKAELGYLKLWILYAGFVENPRVVYWFLMANEVGAAWAVLYEEYAGVLERCSR
jgi:spindle assembly checkpoint component MAD3